MIDFLCSSSDWLLKLLQHSEGIIRLTTLDSLLPYSPLDAMPNLRHLLRLLISADGAATTNKSAAGDLKIRIDESGAQWLYLPEVADSIKYAVMQ